MTSRVLIAHSNLPLTKQLGRLLTTKGFEVGSVSTGLDCLARLRDWQPDLLIVSPKLTWGSGLSVIVLLHEEEDIEPIPTIVISDDNQSLSAPVQPDWIQRIFYHPVIPHSVCMAVCNLLDQNHDRNTAISRDLQPELVQRHEHMRK